MLPFEGRAIQLNSIRVHFDLLTDLVAFGAESGGGQGAVDPTKQLNVFYNNLAGGHSVVDTITTSLNSTGQIENLTNYPRYVAMKTGATMDKDDLVNSGSACEGKCSLQKFTNVLLRGSQSGTMDGVVGSGGIVKDDIKCEVFNCSIKPDFCLNNASAGGALPVLSHSKSGNIRISLRLSRSAATLFGSEWLSTNKYHLENLKLTFISRPDQVTPKLSMETKISIKQSVVSDFSNIAAVVPAVCKSVSCSFQPQSAENVSAEDNLRTYRLPFLTQTQFIWNDSTNKMITYIIKNQAEVIERYLNSFNYRGVSVATLPNLSSNKGFGVGVDFGEYIDLSQQKFSLQLQSSVGTEQVPFVAYLYFHGLISM